ncbi:MAG: hypothetical protein CMM01_09785 [Rhodopirellula sp.]|nr:hypothetical protein [Rhodopirellula sp.]OUX51306.1 MAG: hypothetical protein CBE43_03425 [Rhodopirellula sp. TMED283]
MPAKFESFGIKFLYPDNWKEIERPVDEGSDGVTLELPTGGFVSLEQELEGKSVREIIEEVADSIGEEYDEIEREEVFLTGALPNEKSIDFRFYYLDLLIVSRLIILLAGGRTLILQLQAESRDFDENELVFAAILKQIRESI